MLICSSLTVSRFLSRKPALSYSTWRDYFIIANIFLKLFQLNKGGLSSDSFFLGLKSTKKRCQITIRLKGQNSDLAPFLKTRNQHEWSILWELCFSQMAKDDLKMGLVLPEQKNTYIIREMFDYEGSLAQPGFLKMFTFGAFVIQLLYPRLV